MRDNTTFAYNGLGELPRPPHWFRFNGYQIRERFGLRLIVPTGDWEDQFELPVEVFPPVAELDLDDEGAILDFVHRFGILGAPGEGGLAVAGAERLVALAELAELRQRLYRERARYRDEYLGEFVDEFRLGAGQVKALVACQEELEQDRFSAARLAKRWSPWAPWVPPKSRYHAAKSLMDGVNAGVASIAPQLQRTDIHDPESVVPELGPPKTLFSLCALELYNHIVSERRIRRCANETCQRLFTMQDGRSKYGVHRTDLVKYHTPECARAQAQREYRQRLAKRKGPQRSGRTGGKR